MSKEKILFIPWSNEENISEILPNYFFDSIKFKCHYLTII